jgi:ubiquitin thioesterase OTU1
MAPIRLRHPKGVCTIELLSDSTVQDLQQQIYAQTQILPSRQIRLFFRFIHSISLSTSPLLVKSGYPPRALTIVPELPFNSLGLQRGDQIFVSESPPNLDTYIPSVQPSVQPPVGPIPRPIHPPPLPAPITTSVPDHVEVDGGFLIHRVKACIVYFSLLLTLGNDRLYQTTTHAYSLRLPLYSNNPYQKPPTCAKVRVLPFDVYPF